ncbi:MAG: YybH family protein [Saprospiraceae bacterium]
MKHISILLIAFLTWNCSTPQEKKVDIEAEKAMILENVKAFSENVMAGDAQAVAAAYTTDGKLFPNGLDILEGTETITKYWMPNKDYQITHHLITPSEIKILGDEAYDYGYYEGETLKLEDNTKSTWRGKYVIVWKKIDGDWKIYLDIWNKRAEKSTDSNEQ